MYSVSHMRGGIEQYASERQRLLDEIADLRRQLHEAETRADTAEERLAIQIEANLAQAEVIGELEMRLHLTIMYMPEGEYKEYSDGG
jgi:chromosome segregation ATPase